jgi:hypothetical protein
MKNARKFFFLNSLKLQKNNIDQNIKRIIQLCSQIFNLNSFTDNYKKNYLYHHETYKDMLFVNFQESIGEEGENKNF